MASESGRGPRQSLVRMGQGGTTRLTCRSSGWRDSEPRITVMPPRPGAAPWFGGYVFSIQDRKTLKVGLVPCSQIK
jgi:hypothetical protein